LGLETYFGSYIIVAVGIYSHAVHERCSALERNQIGVMTFNSVYHWATFKSKCLHQVLMRCV